MKLKLYTLLFMLYYLCNCINTQAQVNRREERKNVPYRANYQRMVSSACANHSLEIKEGYIWAWGNNNYGQLGDGTNLQRKKPVRISTYNNWVLISTGGNHSAAIQANGTLWTWGYNNYGQLGTNTFLNKNIPTQIGADSNWISVACGNDFTLAIKADGTLWAWGNNDNGQLGNNTLVSKDVPTQIGVATNWVAIGAGYAHSIAVQANGTLWSWGSNNKGQLGMGNTNTYTSPTQVGSDSIWVSIAAGYEHNMAIKANGTLWTWGANDSAQLGDGTFQNKTIPTLIGTQSNWVSIAAGKYQSLAIQANGTLWACNSTYTIPTQISTAKNWVNIFAGHTHSIALQANGTLWAWGTNTFGQIGNGTNLTATNPTVISQAPNGWLMVSVASNSNSGIGTSMGIKTDGTLWAWGSNLNGQFGNGTLAASNYPIQIGTASNWVCVEITQSYTIALQANGTLWSWGRNSSYLGIGVSFDNGFQTTPVRIGTDSNWASFYAYGSVFGLKADGTLWFWGYTGNTPYYIDTSVTEITTPVQHNAARDWVSASHMGSYCLLKADGSLWAAGDNTFGQLGNGNYTNGTGTTLSRVGDVNHKNWIKITSYYYNYNCAAVQANGTLWTWGFNLYGGLGDGTNINRNSPVQIGANKQWLFIRTGNAISGGRAIAANGTLWAWGANDYGTYGNGYMGTWLVPTQVNNDNNWINIANLATHAIGLKAHRNGFCAVGVNDYGQLGDTTNNSTTVFNCDLGVAPCQIPPKPVADSVKICLGSSAILNASGLGVLSWYSDSIDGNFLGVGANFTPPLLQNSTTYYVQDSTCFVSNRQPVPLVVLAKPKGGFTINNNVQCIKGNQFVFTDTSNIGKSHIKRIWSLGNTDTASLATVNKTYTLTNAYAILLVVYDTNSCTDTITKTIHVIASPQSGFIVNQLNQCVNNNNFIFTDTSSISIGTLNRSWQFGDGGTSINTDSISHKKYSLANTYWVKLIVASENACKDSTLKRVTIYEKPTVKALASDTLICAGNTIVLNGNGAKNYTWTEGVLNGIAFIPTQSKNYQVIGIDSNNCADTNTIHITLKPMPNITTTWSKPTITASQVNASYQWLNCNSNFAPIGGANAQIFTPANNGSYAVSINLNNCIDTSACVAINGIGINEIYNNPLSIYPNPNNGIFTINTTQQGEYKISNELGQTIQSFKTLYTDNSTLIDISNQPNGIYFLQFTNTFSTYTYKLVKQ
ncbi:MAG: T9SS type A sorting domain-containing protein [Bacteroidota bacterium]